MKNNKEKAGKTVWLAAAILVAVNLVLTRPDWFAKEQHVAINCLNAAYLKMSEMICLVGNI